MNKLIIMSGVSGSGKSTLAKKLSEQNGNAPIFSTDSLWLVDGVYYWNAKAIGHAHSVNQAKVEIAMSSGAKCIIVDNTNLSFAEVKPYLDFAKDFGYTVTVERPDTDWSNDPVLLEAKNVHSVPIEVIRKQMGRMLPISEMRSKINEYMRG